MSDNDMNTAQNLAQVLKILPEGKKEFLLGYAEGVKAMAEKQDKDGRTPDPPASPSRSA